MSATLQSQEPEVSTEPPDPWGRIWASESRVLGHNRYSHIEHNRHTPPNWNTPVTSVHMESNMTSGMLGGDVYVARARVRRRWYERHAVESSSTGDSRARLENVGKVSLEVGSMRISHVGRDEHKLLQNLLRRVFAPPFAPPPFPRTK